jgi:hypothetical protein
LFDTAPVDAADDVADNVCVSYAAELRRKDRYRVTYRVLVTSSSRWTIMEHQAGIPTDRPIPSGWDSPSSSRPSWDARGSRRTAARRLAEALHMTAMCVMGVVRPSEEHA